MPEPRDPFAMSAAHAACAVGHAQAEPVGPIASPSGDFRHDAPTAKMRWPRCPLVSSGEIGQRVDAG